MSKSTSALCKWVESFFVSGIILGNDEVKLLKIESFIRFSLMCNETSVHHIEKGLIVHVLSHSSGDLLQLLESNVAFFFCVVQSKNSLQAVFCLVFTDL